MKVLRGVEDGKAFQAGLNNQTSARDLAVLLEAIETGKAASKQSSREMLDILAAQEFNDAIPGGVPAGTPVAHKTGSITGIAHDAGLVNDEYVLVVLTKGFKTTDEAEKVIAEISRIIWQGRK